MIWGGLSRLAQVVLPVLLRISFCLDAVALSSNFSARSISHAYGVSQNGMFWAPPEIKHNYPDLSLMREKSYLSDTKELKRFSTWDGRTWLSSSYNIFADSMNVPSVVTENTMKSQLKEQHVEEANKVIANAILINNDSKVANEAYRTNITNYYTNMNGTLFDYAFSNNKSFNPIVNNGSNKTNDVDGSRYNINNSSESVLSFGNLSSVYYEPQRNFEIKNVTQIVPNQTFFFDSIHSVDVNIAASSLNYKPLLITKTLNNLVVRPLDINSSVNYSQNDRDTLFNFPIKSDRIATEQVESFNNYISSLITQLSYNTEWVTKGKNEKQFYEHEIQIETAPIPHLNSYNFSNYTNTLNNFFKNLELQTSELNKETFTHLQPNFLYDKAKKERTHNSYATDFSIMPRMQNLLQVPGHQKEEISYVHNYHGNNSTNNSFLNGTGSLLSANENLTFYFNNRNFNSQNQFGVQYNIDNKVENFSAASASTFLFLKHQQSPKRYMYNNKISLNSSLQSFAFTPNSAQLHSPVHIYHATTQPSPYQVSYFQSADSETRTTPLRILPGYFNINSLSPSSSSSSNKIPTTPTMIFHHKDHLKPVLVSNLPVNLFNSTINQGLTDYGSIVYYNKTLKPFSNSALHFANSNVSARNISVKYRPLDIRVVPSLDSDSRQLHVNISRNSEVKSLEDDRMNRRMYHSSNEWSEKNDSFLAQKMLKNFDRGTNSVSHEPHVVTSENDITGFTALMGTMFPIFLKMASSEIVDKYENKSIGFYSNKPTFMNNYLGSTKFTQFYDRRVFDLNTQKIIKNLTEESVFNNIKNIKFDSVQMDISKYSIVNATERVVNRITGTSMYETETFLADIKAFDFSKVDGEKKFSLSNSSYNVKDLNGIYHSINNETSLLNMNHSENHSKRQESISDETTNNFHPVILHNNLNNTMDYEYNEENQTYKQDEVEYQGIYPKTSKSKFLSDFNKNYNLNSSTFHYFDTVLSNLSILNATYAITAEPATVFLNFDKNNDVFSFENVSNSKSNDINVNKHKIELNAKLNDFYKVTTTKIISLLRNKSRNLPYDSVRFYESINNKNATGLFELMQNHSNVELSTVSSSTPFTIFRTIMKDLNYDELLNTKYDTINNSNSKNLKGDFSFIKPPDRIQKNNSKMNMFNNMNFLTNKYYDNFKLSTKTLNVTVNTHPSINDVEDNVLNYNVFNDENATVLNHNSSNDYYGIEKTTMDTLRYIKNYYYLNKSVLDSVTENTYPPTGFGELNTQWLHEPMSSLQQREMYGENNSTVKLIELINSSEFTGHVKKSNISVDSGLENQTLNVNYDTDSRLKNLSTDLSHSNPNDLNPLSANGSNTINHESALNISNPRSEQNISLANSTAIGTAYFTQADIKLQQQSTLAPVKNVPVNVDQVNQEVVRPHKASRNANSNFIKMFSLKLPLINVH